MIKTTLWSSAAMFGWWTGIWSEQHENSGSKTYQPCINSLVGCWRFDRWMIYLFTFICFCHTLADKYHKQYVGIFKTKITIFRCKNTTGMCYALCFRIHLHICEEKENPAHSNAGHGRKKQLWQICMIAKKKRKRFNTSRYIDMVENLHLHSCHTVWKR